MLRKLRNIGVVCGAAFGLLALVYPFLSGTAQKAKDQKSQEREKALQIVRQVVVANIFYDKLHARDGEWALTDASYRSDGEVVTARGMEQGAINVDLVLERNKTVVQVSISEYPSEAAAKSQFGLPISRGIKKSCKDLECGDEGKKIYSEGGFEYLMYRKSRFLVYIHCDSEEMAKRFAGYALEAIDSR